MRIIFSFLAALTLAGFCAHDSFAEEGMNVRPPSVVPDSDPAPEGVAPNLVEAVRGKHPRLLLNAERLPGVRAFYRSEAGAPWRAKLEAYLPVCSPPSDEKFLTDATEGQKQGLWRLPTVALHHLLTGNPDSLRRAKGFLEKFQSMPDWETGKEPNSGMSAANIMIGAALAFDWIYDDLDPGFRAQFRDTLVRHARLMYYGGHLARNPGVHYWQGDPANNHRWHRNAGLILSLLASHEGRADEQWILQQAANDLAFVNRWLPDDGTTHEGPAYLTFGGNHLLLAMHASDDCLGTNFLQSPYYKNTGLFRTQLLLPGFKGAFRFGDSDGGALGGYNNFFQKTMAVHRQPEVKDALLRMLEKNSRTVEFGWFSLLWDDPALPRGDVTALPVATFWPDIGTAIIRDSWRDDAVAAMFRCGPWGGYKLNEFRSSKKGGGFTTINVAHDDPDANEFTLALGGDLVVETDGYSTRKTSRAHNTILVNGLGQMSKGRPEGQIWSQPGSTDMTKMAVITAWRDAGRVTLAEGEAAGSYLDCTDKKSGASRPALDRFRRTFLWVKGEYVLVLDDIRAPEPVQISWLIQSPTLAADDEKQGCFTLGAADKTCAFQIVADQPLAFALGESPAETHGKPLGLRQLAAQSTAAALRVASVYNPWQKKPPVISLATISPGEATVEVKGDGFTDVWTWRAGAGRFDASTLIARRQFVSGKSEALLPSPEATTSDMSSRKFRFADLFSDHAVVQQGVPLPVWGFGPEGARVHVRLGDMDAHTTILDGRWQVTLPALTSRGPYVLSATCGTERLEAVELLAGEVWLCAGQSNMEWPVKWMSIQDQIARHAGNPNVRVFVQARQAADSPGEAEPRGRWTVATPTAAPELPALPLLFALRLQAQAGVPVGVVVSAIGASGIKSWLPRESFDRHEALRRYWREYPSRNDDYAARLSQWKPDVRAFDQENRLRKGRGEAALPPSKYILFGPRGPDCIARPGGLFYGMVYPLAPYALRGFAWYQGETDAEAPEGYATWLGELVGAWRGLWPRAETPFLVVQLARWAGSPVSRNWPHLREQQAMAAETLPDVTIVPAIDLGDPANIHPEDKAPLADRLARLALAAMSRATLPRPPVITGVTPEGDHLRVTFSRTVRARTTPITGFEITDANGRYHPADATLTGPREAQVSIAPGAAHRVTLRYLWAGAPLPVLFGEDELPLMPYREDADGPPETTADIY